MAIAVQISLLILFIVIWRLAAGAMDRKRIRKHVESLGGSLLECRWTFWGPDYFGDRDSRIYAVRYVDRDRDTRMAYCKTCLWGGVYFTRDKVVISDKSDCNDDPLEKENLKLKTTIDSHTKNAKPYG